MVETSHRTISNCALERAALSSPVWAKGLIGNKNSELEFCQEGSGYSIFLNIFASQKVPYVVARFEEENYGRQAYEEILNVLNRGGKIYLDLDYPITKIFDKSGDLIQFNGVFKTLHLERNNSICSGE